MTFLAEFFLSQYQFFGKFRVEIVAGAAAYSTLEKSYLLADKPLGFQFAAFARASFCFVLDANRMRAKTVFPDALTDLSKAFFPALMAIKTFYRNGIHWLCRIGHLEFAERMHVADDMPMAAVCTFDFMTQGTKSLSLKMRPQIMSVIAGFVYSFSMNKMTRVAGYHSIGQREVARYSGKLRDSINRVGSLHLRDVMAFLAESRNRIGKEKRVLFKITVTFRAIVI